MMILVDKNNIMIKRLTVLLITIISLMLPINLLAQSKSVVMPQFPGGQAALIDFMRKNINYPKQAKERGLEGTVLVQFVVSKTGEITNVSVKNKVDEALDKEAVRLVQSMPKFIPGSKDGQPVNVRYRIPVTFILTHEERTLLETLKKKENMK